MKNKTLNVEQIWKQFEDSLAPRLGFSVVDRAVYSHLLRHSRLEGKGRLRFSMLAPLEMTDGRGRWGETLGHQST